MALAFDPGIPRSREVDGGEVFVLRGDDALAVGSGGVRLLPEYDACSASSPS